MNLYQWLSLLGVSGLIGTLIGIFVKAPIEKKIAKQEQEQAIQRQQNQALMLGVQAMLRDRLLQGYKFYEEQGYASYEDKSNMENMHKQYESLGENNVMNARHERFIALPDSPPVARHD